MMRIPFFAIVAACLFTPTAAAQSLVRGYGSAMLDALPERDATELRGRLFVEGERDLGPHVRVSASGFVEGLLADRGGRVTDVFAEPHELSVRVRTSRLDLTAGFARVVWGRLDELQPTDVVNPLDLSRFFFEGRSEARLAVPLVRARLFASDKLSIEGVVVPFFRRGRFDRADEATSPFNIQPKVATCAALGCPPVTFARAEPSRTLANSQGGARLNATTGRVDWSVSAYRGFRPFGVYTLSAVPTLVFPRFTMVGGDFETAAGQWGVRGEVAVFMRDVFQVRAALPASGSSLDAGAGVDRKAGSYRLTGYVLVHYESRDQPVAALPAGAIADLPTVSALPATGPASTTETSLVVAADRSFAREKYESRLFAVYNANRRSSFVRGILTAHLRDNLALEGSAGWFRGTAADTIGRFSDSDFVYARLKVYF